MTISAGGWDLGHRLWIEGPEAFRRLPWYLRMLAIAAATYLGGVAIAWAGGISDFYFTSWAFILGSAGCGFVAVSIAQRATRIDDVYRDLTTTFEIPSQIFMAEIGRRFKDACRLSGHLVASGFIFAGLAIAAFASVYLYPELPESMRTSSLRPSGFNPLLYGTESKFPTLVLVGYFAVLISIALGTAAYLAVRSVTILGYLRRLPVPPLAEAVRMRLRGLADLHLHTSRDWTIGLLAFVALFGTHVDVYSAIVMSAIGAMAIVLFALPQFALRDVIIRAHRRATEISMVEWRRHSELPSPSRRGAAEIGALVDIASPPRYWVYGSSELVLWALAQAVAIAAIVFQVARGDG